jgi:hypothetical protein
MPVEADPASRFKTLPQFADRQVVFVLPEAPAGKALGTAVPAMGSDATIDQGDGFIAVQAAHVRR